MKPLAETYLEMGDQAEAGDTSTDLNHWHKTSMGPDGKGKTIQTLPKDFPDHVHEIDDYSCLPAGEEDHTHEVIS